MHIKRVHFYIEFKENSFLSTPPSVWQSTTKIFNITIYLIKMIKISSRHKWCRVMMTHYLLERIIIFGLNSTKIYGGQMSSSN